MKRGVGILRPCEQLKARDIRTRRATGKGVKEMLWAGFGYNTRTDLVALDGDAESARAGVTGRIIC